MKRRWITHLGNALIFLGIIAVAWVHFDKQKTSSHLVSELSVVGALADGERWTAETLQLKNGNSTTIYRTKDQRTILFTAAFAEGIEGYNGEIHMAVMLANDGTLLKTMILRHSETPSYLKRTNTWRESLTGKNLFSPAPFEGVDSVTGATFTSDGITASLTECGTQLRPANTPNSSPIKETSQYAPYLPGAYLVVTALLALIWRFRPSPPFPPIILLFSVLVGGVLLNAQYSLWHLFNLLDGHIPSPGINMGFLLILAVPVSGLLTRTLYCGYLCPFGALQELAGLLTPKRWKRVLPQSYYRIRYLILVTVIAAWVGGWAESLNAFDPLQSIWRLTASCGLYVGGAAILASIFVRRAWCRMFCPAGAFLSLANHPLLEPLHRWLHWPKVDRCDLGVKNPRELGCLHCDRCRTPENTQNQRNDP